MDGVLDRAPGVRRHKLDVRDYYRMAEVGILPPKARVELIEGEIIDMVPIGSDHSGTVIGLTQLLVLSVGQRAMVSVQGPLRLSERNEPQPDLLLLKPREDSYRKAHPTAADVLLLIEVAKTSLAYDRGVKLPLYARHGVPEVWIVDIEGGAIEVHRSPGGDSYAVTHRAARGETLEPALLPGLRIAVAEVLG